MIKREEEAEQKSILAFNASVGTSDRESINATLGNNSALDQFQVNRVSMTVRWLRYLRLYVMIVSLRSPVPFPGHYSKSQTSTKCAQWKSHWTRWKWYLSTLSRSAI